MLHRILVAQLLTLFLDPQGAGPAELMEAFPEEFTSELDVSAREPKAAFPSRAASHAWGVASADLTDALLFLVDRQLVTIEADGRVVPAPAPATEPADGAEREFASGAREEGFATEPELPWACGSRHAELGDLFAFEHPRIDA